MHLPQELLWSLVLVLVHLRHDQLLMLNHLLVH
jgi:hypothetical protein